MLKIEPTVDKNEEKSGITEQHFPKVLVTFQKLLQENTGFPVGVKSLKVFMEVRVAVEWGHMKTIKTEHAISHPGQPLVWLLALMTP